MRTDHGLVDATLLRDRLRERPRQRVELPGFRPSAVLLPIVRQPGAPDRLIFIVRDGAMRAHAGQVAFPGGARDPDDADLVATALRETREELGVDVGRAEVIGLLDDIPTPSHFVITPVVALLDGPLELRPAEGEVADVFIADLGALRDPERYRDDGAHEWMGISYAMHSYRWLEHHIWGATARILHQLFELLEPPG